MLSINANMPGLGSGSVPLNLPDERASIIWKQSWDSVT
jgi:hypothetical protein